MGQEEARLVILLGSLSLSIVVCFVLVMVIVFNKNIQRKQREAFRQILDAVEKEKQRIGRDLHDDVGPILAGLKLGMDSLRKDVGEKPETIAKLDSFKEALSSAVDGIRSSAHDLTPATLLRYGLVQAIEESCTRINRSESCEAIVQGDIQVKLSDSASLSLYRIINELLHNSLKHSDAKKLEVDFIETQDLITIWVRDNGKGFDPAQLAREGTGLGLTNMVNRAKLIGVELVLNSSPGNGCITCLKFNPQKI